MTSALWLVRMCLCNLYPRLATPILYRRRETEVKLQYRLYYRLWSSIRLIRNIRGLGKVLDCGDSNVFFLLLWLICIQNRKSSRRAVGVYHLLGKSKRHLEIKRHFQAQKKNVCLFLSEDMKTGKVWLLMITKIYNLSVCPFECRWSLLTLSPTSSLSSCLPLFPVCLFSLGMSCWRRRGGKDCLSRSGMVLLLSHGWR